MSYVDFLFPVSVALDVAALVAIVSSAILGLTGLIRHGWHRGKLRIAYLAYICSAALVLSFVVHLCMDGGDIYMMFVLWLVPFTVTVTLAILMTLAIGSSDTLWLLAAATIVVGLAQLFAELLPGGIGGGRAWLLAAIFFAYAFLVLILAARRRPEWW